MFVLSGIVVVLGICSAFVSGVMLFFCYAFRSLHDAEIEDMKQERKFEGEPEYMQQVRVTRAEFDREGNERITRKVWVVLIASVALIVLALAVRF